MSFKVGYCSVCGVKQTQVKNRSGMPFKGLVGTRLVWIGLCDESSEIKTRVGTVTVCPGCELSDANAKVALDNLVEAPSSGVNESTPEVIKYPNVKFDLVKTYG